MKEVSWSGVRLRRPELSVGKDIRVDHDAISIYDVLGEPSITTKEVP